MLGNSHSYPRKYDASSMCSKRVPRNSNITATWWMLYLCHPCPRWIWGWPCCHILCKVDVLQFLHRDRQDQASFPSRSSISTLAHQQVLPGSFQISLGPRRWLKSLLPQVWIQPPSPPLLANSSLQGHLWHFQSRCFDVHPATEPCSFGTSCSAFLIRHLRRFRSMRRTLN